MLEKLLLLSEIATLSFTPRIGSIEKHELHVSIDVASQQSVDQGGQNSQIDKNAFDSSRNFQKLLEEWDEPVQSASSENVRLESSLCSEETLFHVLMFTNNFVVDSMYLPSKIFLNLDKLCI